MFAYLDRREGGGTGVVGSYIIRLGEDSIKIISRLSDISNLAIIGVFLLLEGASYIIISIAYTVSQRGDILAYYIETDC